MIRIASAVALALLASPVTAQNSAFCQELWLSRNTVMDRAGQCFQSPLGQATFDNSDCVPGNVRLNPLDAELVRMAQEVEALAGCRVNTDAVQLDPGAVPFRTRLNTLFTVPVRGDSEHGCHGYRGPSIALHAGISTSTTVIGMLEDGQTFSLAHWPLRGGWEFVEVTDRQGTPLAYGWAHGLPESWGEICEFSAG